MYIMIYCVRARARVLHCIYIMPCKIANSKKLSIFVGHRVLPSRDLLRVLAKLVLYTSLVGLVVVKIIKMAASYTVLALA